MMFVLLKSYLSFFFAIFELYLHDKSRYDNQVWTCCRIRDNDFKKKYLMK